MPGEAARLRHRQGRAGRAEDGRHLHQDERAGDHLHARRTARRSSSRARTARRARGRTCSRSRSSSSSASRSESRSRATTSCSSRSPRPTRRAARRRARSGRTVSDEVEAIFQRALAVSPNDRYRTMGDFWNALRAGLHSGSLRSLAVTGPSPGDRSDAEGLATRATAMAVEAPRSVPVMADTGRGLTTSPATPSTHRSPKAGWAADRSSVLAPSRSRWCSAEARRLPRRHTARTRRRAAARAERRARRPWRARPRPPARA